MIKLVNNYLEIMPSLKVKTLDIKSIFITLSRELYPMKEYSVVYFLLFGLLFSQTAEGQLIIRAT